MYSCGPLHTNEQGLGDQLEPIYNSSVLIQDLAWKSFRMQWSIDELGGGAQGNPYQQQHYISSSCCATRTDIYICIFRQHFFINANFIEHNRHFMPTYSLLDPFEFPYYFYRIRGELIKVLSIVVCIPSTFCPTCNQHLIELIFKPVLTYLNVFSYWHYLQNYI